MWIQWNTNTYKHIYIYIYVLVCIYVYLCVCLKVAQFVPWHHLRLSVGFLGDYARSLNFFIKCLWIVFNFLLWVFQALTTHTRSYTSMCACLASQLYAISSSICHSQLIVIDGKRRPDGKLWQVFNLLKSTLFDTIQDIK